MSATAVGGVVSAERVYASWGARVGAYLIDGFLSGFVALIVAFLLLLPGQSGPDAAGAFGTLALLVYVGFPAVYMIWGNGRGQTLGKKALGIKVVGEADGAPIGYLRAFLRLLMVYVLIFVFAIPWLIDSLMPLWDAKKQSIHDKVVGSVVVKA